MVAGKTVDNKLALANEAMSQENIDTLNETIDVIKQEYGEYKLTRKMRKQLAEELGADEETAKGWQTVVDVLEHIDVSELAKKHPETITKITSTVSVIISFVFPVVGLIYNMVPEKFVAKSVELSGKLTPEHIIKVFAEKQVERKKAKQKKLKEAQTNETE